MRDCNERRAAIAEAMTELGEYAAGRMLSPFVRLLEAMAEEAMADLATVTPEKLQRKQGILAQINALKTALQHPGPHASPLAT